MKFSAIITVLAAIALIVACGPNEGWTAEEKQPHKNASSSPNREATKHNTGHGARTHHLQSPPPIDCPLRRQGINPRALKPFQEVEKYITFLERPDRAAWQKPDEVVEALNLKGTEIVSDVGAGSGFFSFPLSKASPQGKVRAIDVRPEMLRHILHKSRSNGISNIDVVLATFDDPKVSRDTDLVFICDVLHHVQNRESWLRRIYQALGSGAKLVLIEFREGDLPAGPPASIKIPKGEMLKLARKVGFRLTDDHSSLLPYQYFLVFSK